jgi:hypothetical protein
MRITAEYHNADGNEIKEQGLLDDAIAAYQKAIQSDGTWSVPWYNLGLVYKTQKNWSESLRCNSRAVQLDSSDEAAWWNLGIAATALQNWSEARRAWQHCGIEVPAGEGPFEIRLGPVPIRINPQGDGEVIWTRRVDPARAIILNVPLAQSGHRYADLLLHDGAPSGYRTVNGKEVPVFDELQVLRESEFGTFAVAVRVTEPDDLTELARVCDESDCHMEDWTSSIRNLCKSCSEGRPHEHHGAPGTSDRTQRNIGIAARSESAVRGVLREWISNRLGCEVEELRMVLAPANPAQGV